MTTDQTESTNLQLVESILKGLAKVRVQRNGWFDSEVEVVEVESLAFKIGESIRPFLLAKQYDPEAFSSIPLEEQILVRDITFVLKKVIKQGFYPSPYSPIPEVKDQYTDFAAFSLEFADLVYGLVDSLGTKSLPQLSQKVASKALSFLTDEKNYLSDAKGIRWAGTSTYRRERKVTEYYTDVYFTSVAIISLRKVLERPVLDLNERQKDKLRGLIRNAGKWIVSRVDNRGLITGDEKKNIQKLIYTTWGLRALVETNDTQEEVVRNQFNPMITAYLGEIERKLDQEGVSLGQEYFTILSPTVDEPLYYEDRSDWGGILLTLISLRKIPGADSFLENTSYRNILDEVYNGLMSLRNPVSSLWYKDTFILSIHSYLIEAFLAYEKFSKDFGVAIGITSGMLRKAIKETFLDESFLSSLQHLVYSKLSGISKTRRQDLIIDKALAQAVPDATNQETSESLAKQQQKKRRKK